MEMFLTVLCLSLFGVGVSAFLFAIATREERRAERAARLASAAVVEEDRFFVRPASVPRQSVRVPIEVLLLQIERHVRLEQAAAESFHQFPTVEALHMQTLSPLA